MDKSTILPQQQREHPEPTERTRPVPWVMLMLVALMTSTGVAYIAHDATDTPAAFGDHRQVAELQGKPSQPKAGSAADGAALYAARCAACHQASGAGVPGAFPPLAGSEWLATDEKRLAALVLHGMTGPITVKGQAYNGAMPAFGTQLDDAEIAAVLTHVRTQWAPGTAPVDAATVAAARVATLARTAPFNGEAEWKAFE